MERWLGKLLRLTSKLSVKRKAAGQKECLRLLPLGKSLSFP
jgi:hypothetical protein